MTPLLASLHKAMDRRRDIADLNDGTTDAYRLCDGAGDHLPGIFIDTLAGHWLVQTKGVPMPVELADAPQLGWKSLWWKRLDQEDKTSPRHLAGEKLDQVIVRENGLRFELDFQAGYSQGIFLDQRRQRRRIQANASGKRILNLFAYTCGFSVAAAAGGALTESIDLSRPYLDWGKRNFELNGLDPIPHFFCRGDSFDWLRRLAKKGLQYDLVILDPPSFSRNQEGKLWRVEKDYASLVTAALAVTKPGGQLLGSTNHHGISSRQFQDWLQAGAVDAGRSIKKFEWAGAPEDFTGERYLKVAWLNV